jgi:hypothetical protein
MPDPDYSKLSIELRGLSKPAQRALINAGIFTVQDLSKRTQRQVMALHGMGPTSIPVLKEALMSAALRFTRE